MESRERETTERLNSCEISINQKGKFSGKVKVYAETIDEAYQQTIKKAQELDALCKQKNGGV